MKQKQGIQLNQAFGAVLTLVLVAVLIVIAIFLFVTLGSSFQGTVAVTSVNETLTTVTEVGEYVSGSANCSFADLSVGLVYNASNIIGSGNYTVTGATGLIAYNSGIGDANGDNNTDWQVNYAYTWGSDACTAGNDMSVEFGNYTSLVGLVGTIIFLGLVIGILVTAFAFGGKREV